MGSRPQTRQEEIANVATHGIGMVLGVVGGCFLLTKAFANGDPWVIGSFIVYLCCMLSSYVTSTFYHAERNPERKQQLRRLDHGAIYLHIAGTYTPFTLVALRHENWWGWGLFAVVWLSALVGISLCFRPMKSKNPLKTICYLLMGWVVVFAFKPLIDVFQRTDNMVVLYWLVAGGLFYSVGTIFFALGKHKYMHPLWHIFVMGGTICHFFSIYLLL